MKKPMIQAYGRPRPATFGSNLAGGAAVSFAVEIYSNGTLYWHDTMRVVLTGVETRDGALPTSCLLEQNYPTPFNPSTTIRYGLFNRSHVTLTVFSTHGQ